MLLYTSMCTPLTYHCTLYKQVGHGRGNFLGKDDSCDSLWPSTFNHLSMAYTKEWVLRGKEKTF